jgi:serine/threonine protein kinase
VNLYDSQGRLIGLGESIGRGGEATVYHVSGQENRLAKVYEAEPRANYVYKLGWMVEHPPENPTRELDHPSLAWPDGLIYDGRKRLKGYSMPFIERAVPLLEVFNPRRRALVLPQFNRRYLHRTARNLAAAFSALHHSGYVAGDVNESNVLVTPSALITLIDTDSFQVREERAGNEIIYHCPVGKPEYTPPELQGKPLGQVTRLPEHDSFGLAVLIFQLLMEGSHPFRAQWLGSGDPPPIEARIARGAYPYVEEPSEPIAPPRNALSIDTLYPPLVDLFHQCFVNGYRTGRWRPRPDVWLSLLIDAEQALVCCAEGHFYSGHLAECPYCAVPKKPAPAGNGRARPVQPDRPRPGSPAPARPSGPNFGAPTGRTTGGAKAPAGTAPSPATASAASVSAASAPAASASGSPAPASQPARSAVNPHPPYRWTGRVNPSAAGAGAGAAPSFNIPGGFGLPVQPASGVSVRPVPGVLRGRPLVRPGAVKNWAKERLRKSLLIGGMQGAMAGALPGIVIGLMNWSANTPLNWALVLALGGSAAGLLRGWQPGHRLAGVIELYIGWKRFWELFGMVIGATIGLIFTLPMFFAIIPVILGLVLGGQVGYFLGGKIWQGGKMVGWQRIWGVISAIGAGAIGFGLSKLIAPVGLNQLGAELAVGLRPFAANGSASWAAIWALAGATGGALVGAVIGIFIDLGGRFSGLVD